MNTANDLHLSELFIEGFRGIQELSIPRLSRVTLLAGMNSVGKSTVLDAIRIWADRARHSAISEVLEKHEEYFVEMGKDDETRFVYDWASLFYQPDSDSVYPTDSRILIGPTDISRQLCIKLVILDYEKASLLESHFSRIDQPHPNGTDDRIRAFEIQCEGEKFLIPLNVESRTAAAYRPQVLQRGSPSPRILRALNDKEWPQQIQCNSLGPGLLSNNILASFWDAVALTPDESQMVEALNLMLDETVVERIAMLGDNSYLRGRQRAVVKLNTHDKPIPLKRLGEGAERLFGVALALANSQDGFLLIDEAENGVHHSVQFDFWRMVLAAARSNNIQIVATTHSWDCVRGFTQAAIESQEVEGLCIRLEKEEGSIRAVEYSEEELESSMESGIEVR